MVVNSIFKLLRLHTSNEKFFIEPLDPDAGNKILEIDRVTQEIVLTDNKGQIPVSAAGREICGIVGIVHLLSGPYLVVILKRKLVGIINGHEVWQIQETDVVPFPRTTLHLTEQQISDNKVYLQMIQNVLQTEGLYFSYTYDLTHSLQRLHRTSSDFDQMPLFERADDRFVWNHNLLRIMSVQPELYRFILPIVQGFVSVKRCMVKQFSFDYILISRRSCYRAGTRYYMRGVDTEGHVANFVETEQMICFQGESLSYVQTRGSIPLHWTQLPSLKYKPPPAVSKGSLHNEAFQLHMEKQIVYYGNQVLLDLIDQKGSEKVLGEHFKVAVNSLNYPASQLRYLPFDFHKECSKMRWYRLSILMDMIQDDIERFGYFHKNKEKLQQGVFRTNCMDCLDRTNVVQSLIARIVLRKQLVDLNILAPEDNLENCSSLEYTFKNVWADNADAISKQYSGTGALKTDFTRTGKRTRWGLLQDGINSAIRYYKNNFSDGFRQDSIDLFLGNYLIDTSLKVSPFKEDRDWKYMTLPAILLIGFSMFVISALIPSTDFSFQLFCVLFWGVSCMITMYFLLQYGTEFVDRPKLAYKVKDKEAENY